ncbi:cytochrome c biogenesis protein ResB [Vulcanimicrobium alpinum]|uniref:Cytochrome c biogenesis protein ResB n=1 Tax=Vulcanimicrobium alpinum TaxID=3016050 RepID=A0AAN2C7Z2_UNVUL|nr:cytochrome c biogenesis protein ResB [Vulcanimicrobium alpinum]BDE04919.1 cytochrome c biogenesis protein ResB [Vulcanimicrobium alpinum]
MEARSGGVALGALRPLREGWNELVALFANVTFGVSLLGIWALLTLIGVVIEQGKDPSFYAANYAPPLARLIARLDLANIYHSAAYIGVLGLILCSMTAATFTKVIPRRIPRLAPVKVEKIPLHATLRVPGDVDVVRERLAAFFGARGWQVRKREFGGTEWTFADKNNWARRGVLVAHVGFVVIAIGTTIYWAKGYSGQFAVLSGQTATIPENGARIALQRFAYRIDPVRTKSGIVYQPIDYVSNAKVTGRDGRVHDAVIRVNQPYDIDGTLIYQASYGFAIDFRLTKDGKPVPGGPDHPLKEGEGFPIGGTSRAIQYTRFVGTIDRASGQPAADPRPNDPGIVIQAYDGDRPVGSALVALGQPLDLGAGYALTPARYVLYSGFQYRYDPGIPIVGLGAFVLLAGLCISFYFLPARLFVTARAVDGATEVGLAATTVKGYDVFEDRFREIVEALTRTERGAGPATEVTAETVLGGV